MEELKTEATEAQNTQGGLAAEDPLPPVTPVSEEEPLIRVLTDEEVKAAATVMLAVAMALHTHRETLPVPAVHDLQTILIPHPPELKEGDKEPPARPEYSVEELVGKVAGWLGAWQLQMNAEAVADFQQALGLKDQVGEAH